MVFGCIRFKGLGFRGLGSGFYLAVNCFGHTFQGLGLDVWSPCLRRPNIPTEHNISGTLIEI